jgi:hypothetical protein
MLPRIVLSLALIVLGVAPATAFAQTPPAAPPGFTLYQLAGRNIGAPPIPMKIEADRVITAPGALLAVTASEIDGDRVTLEFETPMGPARFIGRRDGDALEGLMLLTDSARRLATPVILAPLDQEIAREPDLTAILPLPPGISRIEIVPADASIKAGERRGFVARVFDRSGSEVTREDVEWYASGGSITAEGEFSAVNPGERLIIAIVDGGVASTTIEVTKPDVAELVVFTDVPERLFVGSRIPLEMDALTTVHRWELDPDVAITSSAPDVVAIEGPSLVARAPGRATVTIAIDQATRRYPIEVVPARSELRVTGAPEDSVRIGDAVRLGVSVPDAWPVWSVAGPGATIWPDGTFVASKPGSYLVLATLGDRSATARVTAASRNVAGRIHVQGHGLNVGTQTSDLWPQNRHVYVGTHQANQVRTYDVSDPTNPVLADSQTFDARVVNDVKVSPDGRWLVATREGAANRRNGILVFSLADPAHPELVSEYTETLTAGVHNVFWHGDEIVYAVNDGTGDMHIIDVSDPETPREAGRWGLPVDGRSLHDVWVQDGVAYLSYLRDGLVILDVGGAGKGGTPTAPVQVSRIFYPGGPTHSAFRYGKYVFVGDEDFGLRTTTPNLPGLGSVDPRGPIHVIDVSDLENPRYVAVYEVPEAGAHNFWIQDDVLYVGYYQGGIRVVDVSGELRGDLYRQGREIAYFLPSAPPEGAKVPYQPMVWGVFPMFSNGWQTTGDMFYATDYNSGLWAFTVERPEERPIS